MSESAVRLTFRPDRVAVLTLDQPGSRANILSKQLWTDLESTLTPLRPRADLAGLIVASAKPGIFIAGADLKFFLTLPGPNDPACRDLIEQGLRVLDLLESLPFPTCAAIDGAALGGGLEVALACDVRVCGTNPRVELGLPEVKLGLIPGWGGTQRLPRVVGMERAAEMLTTGESVSGSSAKAIGLADVLDQPGDLVEQVAPMLAELGRLPESIARIPALAKLNAPSLRAPVWEEPRRQKHQAIAPDQRVALRDPAADAPAAVREVVHCLTGGAGRPLPEALKLETEAFLRLAGSPESNQLINAFFASRKKA